MWRHMILYDVRLCYYIIILYYMVLGCIILGYICRVAGWRSGDVATLAGWRRGRVAGWLGGSECVHAARCSYVYVYIYIYMYNIYIYIFIHIYI